MPFSRNFLFRFSLTFGLLFFFLLIVLTLFYPSLKKHVLETQQETALSAKSRVLGFQTPNFELLAQHIMEGYIFNPGELDNWRGGTAYLSFFKKASELFPDEFEMYYMQGVCSFWMGDLPATEEDLRQSLRLNPLFFWTYYNLGLLDLKCGQIDGAITFFSLARKIPLPVTEKYLHDIQAFYIIWRYMPDPQNYIIGHLNQAETQINYFLSVALAVKNHHAADLHFDPNRWNPVFF